MPVIASALSSALLHFLWQGALVAALLAVVLAALRRRSPNVRYLACCAALALMAMLPVVTMAVLYAPLEAADGAVLPVAGSMAAIGAAAAVEPLARDWVLPAWFAGVMLFSLRLAWSGGHVWTLRHCAQPAGADIQETVARLAERLGLRRPVRALLTAATDSPSVLGWLRPVVLLPSATLLGLSTEQLEAVIAHELAHIRRHDYLVNLGQMVVETVLFYHPAVWWVSNRIRHERELCCDDAAVACCGDAVVYARALTQLEKLRAPTVAVAGTGGSLLFRIRRLVGVGQEQGVPRWPAVLAACFGLLCLALTVNWTQAEPLPPQAAALAPPETPSVTPYELLAHSPAPSVDTIRSLQAQVEAAQDDLDRLREQYTDNHPEMLRARETLAARLKVYREAVKARSDEAARKRMEEIPPLTPAQIVRDDQSVRFATTQFLKEQVELAKQELAGLRTQYTEDHPEVRKAREKLGDMEEKFARAMAVAQGEPGTVPIDPDTFDPDTYRIRPQDILRVMVWREPDFTQNRTVRPDGMIVIPLLGDLPAAGLTPTSLAAAIQTRLATYIRDPDVIVAVLRTQASPQQ